MFENIKTRIPSLPASHDNRHELDRNEFSRESLAYMLQLPDQGINGFIYTWVNGLGKAGVAVLMFGPGIGHEPIFEKVDGIAVPADMDFYRWKVGGLTVVIGEPLATVSVKYQGRAITISYEFEGVHPAYSYATGPNGCPAWMATDRFEQHGIATGVMVVGGRSIGYQGYGQRDHSWGMRDWGVNHHWKWIHAQVNRHTSIHVWHLMALGDARVYGFVNKAGCMAQVVAASFQFSCKEGLVPEYIDCAVEDSEGRQTAFTCKIPFSVYPFRTHELSTLYECPLTVGIEGEAGAGWMEMMWTNDMIGHMKNRVYQP